MEGDEPPHLTIGVSYETALAATNPNLAKLANVTTHPSLYGPSLSPSQLAELLCDCKLSRVVFGPDSQLLDVGREHRTAPRPCAARSSPATNAAGSPAANENPSACKAHHVDPWFPDGETKACNCVLLCAFHHGIIHRPGWHDTFDGITYTVTRNGEPLGST